MNEIEKRLSDALLDALMCQWEDNGNVCAGAVRDACIQVLSEVLDVSFDEIDAMVDERINDRQ